VSNQASLASKAPILTAQAEPLLPATEGEFKLPGNLMRDRKPVYEKISRNAYLLKMRPKRRQRDEIGEPIGSLAGFRASLMGS